LEVLLICNINIQKLEKFNSRRGQQFITAPTTPPGMQWIGAIYTEWAKKVIFCIAGCNFVNYGPI